MYIFGFIFVVFSDGRVYDGEWYNVIVVVIGKFRFLYKDREFIYTFKVLIYVVLYFILSFNFFNGG